MLQREEVVHTFMHCATSILYCACLVPCGGHNAHLQTHTQPTWWRCRMRHAMHRLNTYVHIYVHHLLVLLLLSPPANPPPRNSARLRILCKSPNIHETRQRTREHKPGRHSETVTDTEAGSTGLMMLVLGLYCYTTAAASCFIFYACFVRATVVPLRLLRCPRFKGGGGTRFCVRQRNCKMCEKLRSKCN